MYKPFPAVMITNDLVACRIIGYLLIMWRDDHSWEVIKGGNCPAKLTNGS